MHLAKCVSISYAPQSLLNGRSEFRTSSDKSIFAKRRTKGGGEGDTELGIFERA